MFLNKHIAALAFMLVAFLATAEGNENPPDASGLRPADRNLGPKNEKKKGAKNSKAAKTKASKADKDENSDRTLDQSLQDTLAIQEGLRAMYNYDVDAKENCIGDTNTHRTCIYDMFQMGGDFECECRPVDGAEIFEAVDANNDDYITLKEIQDYFESDPCEQVLSTKVLRTPAALLLATSMSASGVPYVFLTTILTQLASSSTATSMTTSSLGKRRC